MDRRKFLGAGLAGVAAAIGGRMGLMQYDGASGQFVPTPALEYDAEKIMPYWKGATCYEYDSAARNGNGGWVDTYLNDGLVGYWDFNTSSIVSDTVLDRSGNENDGAIHGTPITADGIVGQELVFDRSQSETAFVTVPFDPSLNIQSGDFTISAWVRVTLAAGSGAENGHGIIERKDATGTPDDTAGYMLQIVGENEYGSQFQNVPAFTYSNSGGTTTLKNVNRVTAGPYMHLLATFESSTNTATLYVDGFKRGSNAGANPTTSNHDLQIGTHRTANGAIDRPLDGGISEIRLYNRALSKSEIDALAALGAGGGASFKAELQDTFFYTVNNTRYGRNDAVAVYDSSKAKPYRLIAYGNAQVNDYGHRGNNLYESADLKSWNLVAKDITNTRTLQDVVYHNGTYYLYSAAGGAELWSGPSLDNLTNQGMAADGLNDVGAYYDNGTWYLFPEEDPAADAPSGNKVGIWTSDRPDGGFTRQGTAIDVTDRPYYTGDADVIKHDGKYWMFCDCERDHPFYGTALAKSDNLLDWEFITDDIKNHVAGDLQLLETPSGLVAFSEFTHNRFGGIGVWDVTYLPE